MDKGLVYLDPHVGEPQRLPSAPLTLKAIRSWEWSLWDTFDPLALGVVSWEMCRQQSDDLFYHGRHNTPRSSPFWVSEECLRASHPVLVLDSAKDVVDGDLGQSEIGLCFAGLRKVPWGSFADCAKSSVQILLRESNFQHGFLPLALLKERLTATQVASSIWMCSWTRKRMSFILVTLYFTKCL